MNKSSRKTGGGDEGTFASKLQVSGGGRRLHGEQQSLERRGCQNGGCPWGSLQGSGRAARITGAKGQFCVLCRVVRKILFPAGKRAMVWYSKAWHGV